MKHKRPVIAAIIVAGLLVVAVVGTFVLGLARARQPQYIVEQALAKSFLSQSADISLYFSRGPAGGAPDVLELSGAVAAGGRFGLDGQYYRGNERVGIGLRSPEGTDAYLRLANVASLESLLGEEAAEYGITEQRNPLTPLDGRWLTVPAGIKEAALKGGAGRVESGELTDADRQKLVQLYRDHRFITVERDLGSEVIKGADSHHYLIHIDVAELERYLSAAHQAVPRMPIAQKRGQTLAETIKSADRLEIWVAKSDRRIAQLYYAGRSSTDNVATELRLGLSGYNRDQTFTAPTDAKPLFEALEGLQLDSGR